MGLVIPPYDPLGSDYIDVHGPEVVTDMINRAAEDAKKLPVFYARFGVWLNSSTEYLTEVEFMLRASGGIKYMELPFITYDGTTVYLSPDQLFSVYTTSVSLVAQRNVFIAQKRISLTDEIGDDTLTQRDLYWKEWVGLNSNLESDIPTGYAAQYSEADATYSHTDILIGGTDNNELSLVAGTSYRTAVSDLPVFDRNYWEIDISSNVGTLYLGLVSRGHADTTRVGYDKYSLGVKVTGKVITHTVKDGVETAITNIDCSSGSGFTLNRVCFRYDASYGRLLISKDGDTWVFIDPVTVLLPGEAYPSATLYDSTSLANFRLGAASSVTGNYMADSSYSNESDNYSNGIYVLRHSSHDEDKKHREMVPTRLSVGGIRLSSQGNVLPFET